MNVVFDGNVVISLQIEEVSCYYFCEHFYDIFKIRENFEKQTAFLRDTQKNEIIAYCDSCKEKIRSFYFYLRTRSQNYFEEAKIFLIQFVPVSKKWKK